MSVVISGSLVLSDSVSGGGTINANNPVIGYQNLVTTGNITSTTADSSFPVTNLANPSTNLKWVGLLASPAVDEYITVAVNTENDVDYIAIARHNLATAQIPISIEVLDPDASPETWKEVISEFIPRTMALCLCASRLKVFRPLGLDYSPVLLPLRLLLSMLESSWCFSVVSMSAILRSITGDPQRSLMLEAKAGTS